MKKEHKFSKGIETKMEKFIGINIENVLVKQNFVCNNFEPDSYDANGNLTVNSWDLFRDDELASEQNEINK